METSKPHTQSSYDLAWQTLLFTVLAWGFSETSQQLSAEAILLQSKERERLMIHHGHKVSELFYEWIQQILWWFFAILGVFAGKQIMKGFGSMRFVAATAAILMVPSSFYLRYIFTHKIPYSEKAIYEQFIYGTAIQSLSNFAEGMFMVCITSYLSLRCKPLGSGIVFGIFFLSKGIQILLECWSEKFLSNKANIEIYVGVCVVSSIVGAFGFLQLPEERTHFQETEWHEEEVDTIIKQELLSVQFWNTIPLLFIANYFMTTMNSFGFHTSGDINDLCYIGGFAGCTGACFLFGWNFSQFPDIMKKFNLFFMIPPILWACLVYFNIIGYVMFWSFWVNVFMGISMCGILVQVFSYFREEFRRTMHIECQGTTWYIYETTKILTYTIYVLGNEFMKGFDELILVLCLVVQIYFVLGGQAKAPYARLRQSQNLVQYQDDNSLAPMNAEDEFQQ